MALTRKKLIESVNKIQTFCKNQKTCSGCLFCVDVKYCSVHNPRTWNVPRSEISVRLSEDEIDELVSLSAYKNDSLAEKLQRVRERLKV